MLGEWEDELGQDKDGKQVYITEFYSKGPKSYAYRTTTGEVVCKIKGFTLNHKNSEKLNIRSMENILLNCEAPEWAPENDIVKQIIMYIIMSSNMSSKQENNYRFQEHRS